jgi:phosphoglucosamine mutase
LGKLFGTDGVRGIANQDLSPELAFKLGQAGAYCLGEGAFVIGKDTRISGDLLEAALVAGICSSGGKAIKAGVLPTPAVAYLTKAMHANGGIVISASHNPAEYNGIKFFGSDGYKLADAVEEQIEEVLNKAVKRPSGQDVGIVKEAEEAVDLYINHVIGTIPGDLDGFKVAIDCAHGAAWQISPMVLRQLGAEVLAVNTRPNGLNINLNCGSTHLEYIKEIVTSHDVDLGLAHDGDADRVIAIDEKGNIVDGDYIMAISALHLKQEGLLDPPIIVTTVMTNMGFDLAMQKHNIKVFKTKVGDRFVIEEMLARGAIIGGEQSGHIVFHRHTTTGDGIITALQLMVIMRDTGKKLSELRSVMEKLPQVLINVPVSDKSKIARNEAISKAIQRAEKELNNKGRILVRPSGTEPLVRIMVECERREKADKIAAAVAEVIEKEVGVGAAEKSF